MKKFFEQIITDSVSAVKDELLARLAESGNKFKNQQDSPMQKTTVREPEPKKYQAHKTIVSSKNGLILKGEAENADDDELPIVVYPDSPDGYQERISEPTEDDVSDYESDFSDGSDENFDSLSIRERNSGEIPPASHGDSSANHGKFLKSKPKITKLNAEEDFPEDQNKVFQNTDGIGSRISPSAHRNLFSNHENFSDGEHKISMLNAYNKNRRLNIMVLGAVFGLVFCLLMLTFYKGDLPGEVVGIISTVSGIFGSCLKDAYSFEFGSSRGSKEKDDKITSTLLKRLKI